MTDDVPLRGKVALVTGGTRGLGRVIAERLARAGCRVVACHLRDEPAEPLPDGVTAVRADVTRSDAVVSLVETVGRRHGRLDFFVHNAVAFHPMSASDLDANACARDMEVALGPFVHGIGPLAGLLAASGGRIVVVSSTGGSAVVPRYVSLGMAKAALEHLVRYLAVELAPRGVAVNAVACGKLDEGEPADAGPNARIVARTPLGRLVTRAELADTVSLLCHPRAGALHGQVITVDGGLSLLA
ncbi:SDR family NAD(P)-dependent oxidoreductase [Streptomyces olivaceoviridis]|uniref:SDR family NAD(P)-dependent oxidoreductase n=1 Tax=Streptomyces olivaceoviridis TaxID=1921 RepID=UPI0036C5698F